MEVHDACLLVTVLAHALEVVVDLEHVPEQVDHLVAALEAGGRGDRGVEDNVRRAGLGQRRGILRVQGLAPGAHVRSCARGPRERRATIDQSATAMTTVPAVTSTNTEISPRVVSSLGEP